VLIVNQTSESDRAWVLVSRFGLMGWNLFMNQTSERGRFDWGLIGLIGFWRIEGVDLVSPVGGLIFDWFVFFNF
jgi:hypothetical protein